MIFVTLGTQKFQLNRLINALDTLVEKKILDQDAIIIQNGYSIPSKYCKSIKMISEKDFEYFVNKANIIICHGGTSSIIKGLIKGKKVIAIPRDHNFNEHVDDHQFEIVNVFQKKGFIESLIDVNDDSLKKCIEAVQRKTFIQYTQNKELANYVIENILEKR